MTASIPASCVFSYAHDGRVHINMTSRCLLRCVFCPRSSNRWVRHGRQLYIPVIAEPSAAEVARGVSASDARREVVFDGLGEPTMRLYEVLEVASMLKARGAFIRLNTNGLANLTHGRDVSHDLEGCVDAVTIGLNAQTEAVYNRHCRPLLAGSYASLLEFASHVGEFVPEVELTAVADLDGVDLEACGRIAARLGARFRVRRPRS